MTQQELVETRHLTVGVNILISFLYDEQQLFKLDAKYYNQYGAIYAMIALHIGLTNDLISTAKELDIFEPNNMIQKYMADGQTLDEAYNSLIATLEKLMLNIEFVHDLAPSNQKDFILVYLRIAAYAIPFELTIPRYGWKVVKTSYSDSSLVLTPCGPTDE